MWFLSNVKLCEVPMKSRLPLTRRELTVVASEICSTTSQRKWLVGSLKLLTKEVVKQKKTEGLVAYPDLRQRQYVREVVTGEYRKNQGRQRRRIRRIFPLRNRGAKRYLYAEYLMKKLGELYVRVTGQRPTRGGTSGSFSQFEQFAYPFHAALGIGDFRNRVRRYLVWRKSQGL